MDKITILIADDHTLVRETWCRSVHLKYGFVPVKGDEQLICAKDYAYVEEYFVPVVMVPLTVLKRR